ncbi:MAG: ECF transporter S component [Oscillospiraceae bacterium]|nr:ECF transporter S component [Oscillospiraceae bacterium]
MNRTKRTKRMTVTAMFAAVATVLMFLETPLPMMPPFLKLDPSALPILIGSFILGPSSAAAMAFIKAFVHVFSSTTGGVGELADFLMTFAFAATAAVVYRRHHTKKGAVLACVAGTVALTVTAMLANYFLLIPFYSNVMPLEAIFAACEAVNPNITGMSGYIFYGVMPFNLFKGAVISLITFPVYKKLSNQIHKFVDEVSVKKQSDT